jgi:starch synthase
MKILIASSEVVPFIKTGGLGDVAGTLVNEFRKSGVEAYTILPLYRSIRNSGRRWGIRALPEEISVQLGEHIETGRVWTGKHPEGADAYFIENDRFYDREEIYSTSEGNYPDNASRFIFFCRGIIETIKALSLQCDIIHCNDWQTGLVPAYLKTIYGHELSGTSSLLSIHNIGYQGIFPSSSIHLTGLEGEMTNINDIELNGKINFLKSGILYADLITTVSNTYSEEILRPEFGYGLEGVLRARKDSLYGIINGIDYSEWSPEDDTLIRANYSKDDLSGKTQCKKSLQKALDLPVSDVFLIGMVTRLAYQKGLDLVLKAMGELMKSGFQMIILGKGDEDLHRAFKRLQKKYSGQLSVTLGFDNTLAHKIYAGSDIFLMPSKYEPCGLGQLIALRYGTIPVARKTGGLADTIIEYNSLEGTGTGFLFDGYSSDEMIIKTKKAKALFDDKPSWSKVRKNAMTQNFSWRNSAEKYISLYNKIITRQG